MRFRNLVLVTLAVIIAAAAGVLAKLRSHPARAARQAFTLVSRVTYINPNDNSERVAQETRYVSSDGGFHTVHIDLNGQTREYFFEPGRGYFSVNHQKGLLFQDTKVSPSGPTGSPLTAEQLRSSPQLIRTEKLFGLTSYVLRVMEVETGLPSVDIYRTVELGSTPLKVINYADGKVATITDPVNIVWGEPTASLLKGPAYPVAQP